MVCETPPALSAGEAKKLGAAASKAGKVLLYAAQRRFGAAEQAAVQALEKGYAGEAYHVRASWMRSIEWRVDAVNHGWQKWVIGFDHDRQQSRPRAGTRCHYCPPAAVAPPRPGPPPSAGRWRPASPA